MHYLYLPALGLYFFCMLHFTIKRFLILAWETALTEAQIYVIACRCVSGLQGMLTFVIGAIVALSCKGDIMKDVHWLTNWYTYFGMPYFMYDLWAMYAYNVRVHDTRYKNLPNLSRRVQQFVSSNKLMVAHHVLLPAIISPIVLTLRDNRGDYFFGVFFMFEIVIPFISAREILIQIKLKDTYLYAITSLAMIVVFFFARLVIFPFLFYSYACYADIPFLSVPFHIPIKCTLSSILLLAPQVYWFGLMVRGMFRAFHRISSIKRKGVD